MDYSFGAWVRRRRKALDLTQQELARRVGCSLSLIFKIESDERRPSRQIAELFVDHLEIPPDQRELFLKVARQEKGVDRLDVVPALSGPSIEPPPEPVRPDLPLLNTPLFGREHEIRAIIQQIQDPGCRLLTLTGPGGVGKTRLAIEVAHRLESEFADGVFFIQLAGLSLTESIIPAMADALGIVFSGPADQIRQLASHLRGKASLIVIDNFEHLLAGGNMLVPLIQQAHGVKILLTSREQVHLQLEWIFEVQGLPVPDELHPTTLGTNSAVALFLQRARQTSQTFTLDDRDASALIRICQMVDGLPLAIELAASWVRVLSCSEIARELEKNFDFLATPMRDVPERHRSIRSVFEHSWNLLSGEERTALMKLSIFKGGFKREAAEAVANTTLPLLSSLVTKSLLRHNKSQNRYDVHELVRQYSFAHLQSDSDAFVRTSELYAVYYAEWLAGLEGPFKSQQQPQVSSQIRAETGNWQSAWGWAVENLRIDLLRRMAPCLNWYLEVHGYYAEALTTFKAAMEKFRSSGAPDSLSTPAEKSAFAGLIDQVGWFEFRLGNVEKGAALLAESLDIAREYDDPEILCYIYGNWGYLCLMAGDIPKARRMTTESLVCARRLDSPWHIAIAINVLGIVAYQEGNLADAHRQLTESLKLWRSVGDPRGLVFCMVYIGMTTFALKDNANTRSTLEESNKLAEANMDRWAHAFGLDMLGMVSLSERQYVEALDYFNRSNGLLAEIGDQFFVTETIIHMGQAYAGLGAMDEARQLFLDAYTRAKRAGWVPVILNALICFIEIEDVLSEETKFAAAVSILAHPSVSPHLRERSENLRDATMSSLTPQQLEEARRLAAEKTAEIWAHDVLK